MTRGAVGTRLDPRIRLEFLDMADVVYSSDVEIDTAFAGFVSLPTDLITLLGLQFAAEYSVELADGTIVNKNCYFARVNWQGIVRTVRAYEMGTNPLVGINFLWGHRLTIDVKVGGDVIVEPLP
jgi:predicted aspartyl protease